MTNLKKACSLFVFCSAYFTVTAQVPANASITAYSITKLSDRFHIAPRPINDSFSLFVFTRLIKELDEDKVYFTKADIDELSAYKFGIDEEVKAKQVKFLAAVTKILSNRLAVMDTMISSVCAKPFNFSVTDKFTIAENKEYPSDAKAQRGKLYKLIKLSVLNKLLDEDELYTLDGKAFDDFLAKQEILSRKKTEKRFINAIKMITQYTGGLSQYVADEYCKAIALSYDPHTEFFPKAVKDDFETEIGQDKIGFGFSFKEEGGILKINSINPGSPAYKSGQMNKGDEVVSFQWGSQEPLDVRTAGADQFRMIMKMNNQEKATFKLKKLDGTERSVVLFKEKLIDEAEQNRVKSFILKGTKTIGFISLPAFYQDWDVNNDGAKGCANDVAKEILKLKKENIEGLILDLRYNGGGSMQEAIDLSGIFIDAGPVGQQKSKDPKVFTLKDISRGTVYDGPLMLMVNGYSASASEMVAGTLQDYHRAVIIGAPTYGKATAQAVLPLDTAFLIESDITAYKTDNFLKLTLGELYRITGNTAQAMGVIPDILVPDVAELTPQQEKFNDRVILSKPIEANKYYRPLPQIAMGKLQQAANEKMAASDYFKKLSDYNTAIIAERNEKDETLMLRPAMAEMKAFEKKINGKEEVKKKDVAFSVQNNIFTTQQEAMNVSLKEFNEQWIRFLENDPYLGVAYAAMLEMVL